MNIQPSHSVCPNSGALVFHKPKFVKQQEEVAKVAEELKTENKLLKSLLSELVAAQSQSVKSKLSPELLAALSDESAEPQQE